jgi:MoaA/NifB/PqqE/SkfB family radical SAM enzyme
MGSDTLCVIPWSSLVVQPDGCVSFCCDAPGLLTDEGRPVVYGTDSFDKIWNAPELVQTRSAMARGERPELCRACWEKEAGGATSRRQLFFDIYAGGGGELALDRLADYGADTGYRLQRGPDWFLLELGNVCNLKCRSCSPLFSSKIGGDPVHAAWAGDMVVPKAVQATVTGARPDAAATNAANAWFKQVDGVADTIAAGAVNRSMLSLVGGEPFLIRQSWDLLEALVQRGVAGNIIVGVSTNGQQRSDRMAELVPHFRGFSVAVSVDGHGRLYEYLRHGGKWERLVGNIDWLKALGNVDVNVTVTLQNANALDLVPLLMFVDERGLGLHYNIVSYPERLRPGNLPEVVLRRAEARLREYLATECSPRNTPVVRAYAEALAAAESFDPARFEEFMTFTNDMDAFRGESLAEAAPELVARLAEAGVSWSANRRHRQPVAAAA